MVHAMTAVVPIRRLTARKASEKRQKEGFAAAYWH